jgi:aerobic carbon-monoxide dehydrogenase large subunit
MTTEGIGVSVRRKEDMRFLTGRGHYVSDIHLPRTAHAIMLRSPHAHARISTIDIRAAQQQPGVLGVYTAADLAADKVGTLPCGWVIKSKNDVPQHEPAHPVLAEGRARYVGDPVVMIVGESLQAARDGAEAVIVDYEEMPVLVDMVEAIRPGAPRLYDEVPDNICFDWEIGNKAATDAAFACAAHIATLDLINNRLVPNAMEPRAAIGDYNPGTGEFTLYTSNQNPHTIRILMGDLVLHIPENKLRVFAPDVGGGFGVKCFHYPEEALVTWAAGKLARPVKWVSERQEGFISDAHARDHVTKAALALDQDGKFLGLKVETLANLGGYLSTFAPNIPTNLYGMLLAGVYTTPAIYCEVKGVFTNTVPVDAYRGAGRPEATYVLERLVDVAATEMGIDRVDLRRRNFIPASAHPYQTPVLLEYDTGDHHGTLEAALVASDWNGFEQRKAESLTRGKFRGIGMSCYIEACGLAPSRLAGQLGARAGLYESANVRVHPTGAVTVYTGAHSHGQGHETTFAQLVAEQLDIPIDHIDIVHGDTAKVPFGLGTVASRSLAVGGVAIAKALDKVIKKGKKIAAHLLEAADSDIEFKQGSFRVAGTDRTKTFREIARAAYVPHDYPLEELEPGLDETCFYDPVNFTYPGGCHVAEVEVDSETGTAALVRYTAVDDVGRVINPMIVEGQVHGAVAQGVGQALFENGVYDGNGQLQSGTFMDYCMPRADDLPDITVQTHSTLCTHNVLGVKGVGEVGTIGSPPAVINAVVDAVSQFGVKHVDMPATPQRMWMVLDTATRAAG